MLLSEHQFFCYFESSLAMPLISRMLLPVKWPLSLAVTKTVLALHARRG